MYYDQQTIRYYVMDRVQTGREMEAQALLQEGFQKMDEGAFTKVYMDDFMARLLPLIRPECAEGLKRDAAQAGYSLVQ